jgi:hypothetical protein
MYDPDEAVRLSLWFSKAVVPTPPRTNVPSHRAVRTRRPAPRVSWSRVVRIGTAALVIGAGSYWLGKRASQPPAFTPLVDGRVTPSLFQDGRPSVPRMPMPLGPSRGAPPAGLRTVGAQPSGRGPVPGVGMPRPLMSARNVSTVTSGPPEVKTVAVVELNSATLDQLQTLPGITRDYATRIVAGRPYRVFSDVVTRAGIPAAIVNELSPPATIRSVDRAPSAEPPVGPGH